MGYLVGIQNKTKKYKTKQKITKQYKTIQKYQKQVSIAKQVHHTVLVLIFVLHDWSTVLNFDKICFCIGQTNGLPHPPVVVNVGNPLEFRL